MLYIIHGWCFQVFPIRFEFLWLYLGWDWLKVRVVAIQGCFVEGQFISQSSYPVYLKPQ